MRVSRFSERQKELTLIFECQFRFSRKLNFASSETQLVQMPKEYPKEY